MSTQRSSTAGVDPDGTWLYRLGGGSALAVAAAYVVIIPLYAQVGAPPSGGEAWLGYAAGKTTVWWAILGLSVLTDLLLVPVAFALNLALRGINRNAMWRPAHRCRGRRINAHGRVLLILPGPGLLLITAGLILLATEYAWAQRWLACIRECARRPPDGSEFVVRLTAGQVGPEVPLTEFGD